MPTYFRYATAWPPERIAEVTTQLADGALHPNAAKRLLGRTVVDLYHGAGAGAAAEAEFDRVFKDRRRARRRARHDRLPGRSPAPLPAGSSPRDYANLSEPGSETGHRGGPRVKVDGEPVGEDRVLAPAELDGKVVQVGRQGNGPGSAWTTLFDSHVRRSGRLPPRPARRQPFLGARNDGTG